MVGSAATAAFDPQTSDIDFSCDLGEYEPGVADRLFAFADTRETLLGRDVDLMTAPMIRTPTSGRRSTGSGCGALQQETAEVASCGMAGLSRRRPDTTGLSCQRPGMKHCYRESVEILTFASLGLNTM